MLRADDHSIPTGVSTLVRGAHDVASGTVASTARARHTRPAMLNGSVGLAMIRDDKPTIALIFTIHDDKITNIDVIGQPERLRDLDIALLTS